MKDAQKAMIASGLLVDLQFLLFLVIGVWLFVFFKGAAFSSSDLVFPTFIIRHLPHGLLGLVLAAIFATGQSTLSATLSSLASSTLLDLFPNCFLFDEKKRLRLSRFLTLMWAAAIAFVALVFTDQKSPVVVIALKLASILAGGLVALYALGFMRARPAIALVGFLSSALAMAVVTFLTPLAWTWYVPTGFLVAMLGAALAWLVMRLLWPSQSAESSA